VSQIRPLVLIEAVLHEWHMHLKYFEVTNLPSLQNYTIYKKEYTKKQTNKKNKKKKKKNNREEKQRVEDKG
jgi:hypothetical protein